MLQSAPVPVYWTIRETAINSHSHWRAVNLYKEENYTVSVIMNNIIFTCNHLETSESISEFVHSKFSRLSRHYDDIIRIRVELKLDSGEAHEKRFIARAIIEQRGPDIVAAAEAENAYAALDTTLRRVERQLRHRARLSRYKRERVIHRLRRSSGRSATVQDPAFA